MMLSITDSFQMIRPFYILAWSATLIVITVLTILFLIVLKNMLNGTIDLSRLLCEDKSEAASMARMQFLIFTIVISVSFLIITLYNMELPKEISENVLALMGISAGTYAVGKGISNSGGNKSSEEETKKVAEEVVKEAAEKATIEDLKNAILQAEKDTEGCSEETKTAIADLANAIKKISGENDQ